MEAFNGLMVLALWGVIIGDLFLPFLGATGSNYFSVCLSVLTLDFGAMFSALCSPVRTLLDRY